MHVCTYGWKDVWMDGWMDEWMDGWMDGWVDAYTYTFIHIYGMIRSNKLEYGTKLCTSIIKCNHITKYYIILFTISTVMKYI